MIELQKVWKEVKYLLSDNISLIPVRDKAGVNYRGESRPAKTPFGLWSELQNSRMTEAQLWDDMEKNQTSAVAIVCGKVSGGIEVIDVDVKYKPGIDALLLKDLQTLFPDLYDKLRIHRTPSKGCHIIYRITGHIIPGNTKLAGRVTTPEEQEEQILAGKKKIEKAVNFLETRGEGGYILAPPSMGYAIVQDNPIPTLTWEERCSIVALCHTYTELVKYVPAPKPPKAQEDQYSLNPFEDYNLNGPFIELLEQYDWTLLSENADRYLFTRPGKDAGVSATWHKDTRCFYVFTSSTEFEPSTGYNPATVLSILMFEGDKAKTYKHLSNEGYGVFKPYVEDNLVQKHVLSKKDLPNNVSAEARENYEKLKAHYEENIPFGRFWNILDNKWDKFEISREDLYRVAHGLGYRLYNKTEIVHIQGQLLYKQTEKEFFNTLKKYIWEENAHLYTAICNAFEAFLQKSGTFTVTRLKEMTKEAILADGSATSYKYFTNGVLRVTADQCELLPYEDFNNYIWQHKIYPREWQPERPRTSTYVTFLQNAIGVSNYLKKVIGYLAHDFKTESSGYLIVLTEKTIDPKDGGGSGKNIFGNILSGTTTIKTVPGSSVKFDDAFLSAWNYERIYFLADIPKKIDWLFLKEMVTGAGYMNKKYIAVHDVPADEMPKILLNTNYSFDDQDGGIKRRIRQLEFSSYYTVNGGVDTVHGKMFPGDFDEYDWAGYDHFIVESLQELFRAKGKIERIELSQEGWTKKFNIKHHESTFTFINERVTQWCDEGYVTNSMFKDQYSDYCNEEGIPPKYRKELNNLTAALKDYCQHFGITMDANKSERIDGVTTKIKKFGEFNYEEI